MDAGSENGRTKIYGWIATCSERMYGSAGWYPDVITLYLWGYCRKKRAKISRQTKVVRLYELCDLRHISGRRSTHGQRACPHPSFLRSHRDEQHRARSLVTYRQLVVFGDDLLLYPIDEFGARVRVFRRSEQICYCGYFREDDTAHG